MAVETEAPHERQTTRVRAVVDFIMGAVLLLAGAYLLLIRISSWRLFAFDPSIRSDLLGVLFVAYGLVRIFRGYKRNKLER